MAPTIVATAGATNANSFITAAEGDTFADARLGTLAWSSASADDKARSLVMATNGLETLEYIGTRAATTQALSWPRENAKCGDKSYTKTEIPDEVKLATFELANALITTPTLLQNASTTTALVDGIPKRDLSRLKLDVMEIEWRDNISSSTTKPVTPLTVLPHLATILGCLTTSTASALGGVFRVKRN